MLEHNDQIGQIWSPKSKEFVQSGQKMTGLDKFHRFSTTLANILSGEQ